MKGKNKSKAIFDQDSIIDVEAVNEGKKLPKIEWLKTLPLYKKLLATAGCFLIFGILVVLALGLAAKEGK